MWRAVCLGGKPQLWFETSPADVSFSSSSTSSLYITGCPVCINTSWLYSNWQEKVIKPLWNIPDFHCRIQFTTFFLLDSLLPWQPYVRWCMYALWRSHNFVLRVTPVAFFLSLKTQEKNSSLFVCVWIVIWKAPCFNMFHLSRNTKSNQNYIILFWILWNECVWVQFLFRHTVRVSLHCRVNLLLLPKYHPDASVWVTVCVLTAHLGSIGIIHVICILSPSTCSEDKGIGKKCRGFYLTAPVGMIPQVLMPCIDKWSSRVDVCLVQLLIPKPTLPAVLKSRCREQGCIFNAALACIYTGISSPTYSNLPKCQT